MITHFKVYILILFFFSSLFIAYADNERDSLLKEVDIALANKSQYESMKQNHLTEMRQKIDSMIFSVEKFHALGDLMDEYNNFNTDSALNILLQREKMANELNDSVLILNVIMNRANLMTQTAMYMEASELINSVDINKLPSYLHPYYYFIKRTLNGRLADYALVPDIKQKYDSLTSLYRDSLLIVNEPSTVAHTIILADKYNEEKQPEKAVKLLNEYILNNNLTEHDLAIIAWTRSESFRQMGDDLGREKDVMISSIADIKSGIREYVSLRELAKILEDKGDFERAYQLLEVSMEDASKSNVRQRIVELKNIYPEINGIYIDKINSQKRRLGWTIGIITVLSLCLLALLLYTIKQMKEVNKARKTIHDSYLELDKINNELKDTNQRLSQANKDIAEISQMKEVYIAKYMDQCLEYIDKLESFRKSIDNMLRMGKTEELKRIVKSNTAINEDLKHFYDQFDQTFLKLFPTFIEDFNALLQPEEIIIPKKANSLTTELRIFALIRLGINDSERISKFLRYSLTTIYNYRTRVRNKAKGDRNKLEEDVMKIGTESA